MKLLLGVISDSGYAEALEQTIERADIAGDQLSVVIIDDPETDTQPEEVREAIDGVLSAASIDVEIRHIEGDPGSRLVEIAETEGFDRIVLGGGQTSPMGKIKISNTAEFVLLNSHTSVTLVR
jgi:nucleotide-binding universal stress UspA family protein